MPIAPNHRRSIGFGQQSTGRDAAFVRTCMQYTKPRVEHLQIVAQMRTRGSGPCDGEIVPPECR